MTERSLWGQGCSTWHDLLANPERFACEGIDKDELSKYLRKSVRCLEIGEHQFFQKRLGVSEAWRAFSDFRSSCVYLDIETDGGQSGSSVTMIGLYDGSEFRCLLKGEDLGNFPDVISHYSMIVTFFGNGFDLPMLQKCFKGLRFDQIHIDLCPTLKRLGFRGGLKKIEKQMGIERSSLTDGLTGRDAIRLWRRYTMLHDDAALETLIAYNREDVINLESLAEMAYKRLKAQTYQCCLPV